MSHICWRAQAFQGRFLDSGSAPYVSTLHGTSAKALQAKPRESEGYEILADVTSAIERNNEHGHLSDRKAVVKPFMTVVVERWTATDAAAGDAMSVARLQMIIDGRLVHGNVWIRDVGFVDLNSLPFVDMDGIWETAARMLKGLREPDRHTSG
ncbi:hypothetical protein [Paraburkholderia terrae]|jgi:hypothetical protein|uniref:Uncharacterized protein n=1 Tax=Paraburkholderia terrae TaxID=311230 RepID=A0A2I8EZI7_9BURK|nr:hypothetical protein [Paraburkholderia terrae]AUT64878.1 hypothetical protein C2L65_35240 [Paraburkholderia terrae]